MHIVAYAQRLKYVTVASDIFQLICAYNTQQFHACMELIERTRIHMTLFN